MVPNPARTISGMRPARWPGGRTGLLHRISQGVPGGFGRWNTLQPRLLPMAGIGSRTRPRSVPQERPNRGIPQPGPGKPFPRVSAPDGSATPAWRLALESMLLVPAWPLAQLYHQPPDEERAGCSPHPVRPGSRLPERSRARARAWASSLRSWISKASPPARSICSARWACIRSRCLPGCLSSSPTNTPSTQARMSGVPFSVAGGVVLTAYTPCRLSSRFTFSTRSRSAIRDC